MTRKMAVAALNLGNLCAYKRSKEDFEYLPHTHSHKCWRFYEQMEHFNMTATVVVDNNKNNMTWQQPFDNSYDSNNNNNDNFDNNGPNQWQWQQQALKVIHTHTHIHMYMYI